MLFGDKILDYWDDILKDLEKVIAIPSVCSKAEGIYPFGKNAARAIDFAMETAESYGLTTKNVDYYACHAEIGSGEENAVVMAHLDVVPEGEGWNTAPFEMVIKDGYAFGRGVSDNKGPAIVALHCLRALKDHNIKGNRKLRVILGSAEEVGMEDMPHYFEQEQKPTMGFTPDSDYGICNCEKGILHFTVKGKENGIIKSFKSGTVVNAVPYKAEAEVLCSQNEYDILAEACYKLGDFVINKTDDGAYILSKGVASHASAPDGGKNAASHLIDLLYSVFGNKIGDLLTFSNNCIGLSTDGSKIGVDCEDEPSGKLTFNLGLVSIDNENSSLSVDIRYPVTCDGDKIINIIKTQVENCFVTFDHYDMQAPLYVPADSQLVDILSTSYEVVTGEKCNVYSMGGGTYARQMFGNGLAFGANFAGGRPTNVHNCNEEISLEELKIHAQICLEAMYRMYTA